MKKIYLLITSALLLIGSGTMWADYVATVDGEKFETIDAAITEWSELGKTTLTLLADCEYDAGDAYCDLYGTKTLDLNDKTLTWKSTNQVCIYSNDNGVLNIVDNSGSYNGKLIFNTDKNGLCTYDGNATINISNCIVSGTGNLIYQRSGTVNVDNSELVSSGSSFYVIKGICNVKNGSKITANGDNYNAFSVFGSGEDVADYSVLSIGDDVTVSAPNGNGICIFGIYDTTSDCYNAYGVKVDMKGTTSSKSFCISTNGNMIAKEGNLPEINVSGKLTSTNEAAIYAAGYAIWNLVGAEVTGAEGIYAKSGTVNISGGTVTATGAVGPATSNCNGNSNTGDAIIMDTNECYAGAVLLNIYGDAKITSTNGYAIQEVITNGTTSSAAGIAITGDETMLAGGAGSVQMTDNFRNAMINGSSSTYEWILNGISGGVYSELPSVVADGYVVQKDGDYYKVVPKPEEPVAPASQTTYIINNSEWDYAVNLTNSSAIVVKTGATFKVKGIEVNRADADDVSKVTVEPGAKLIVGSNGIQTNDANALALQTDASHGMGMLLYDGSTTATSPYGTAELCLYSKKIGEDNYIWQHFGIPTVALPAIEKNVTVSVSKWDVKKGWVWDGGLSGLTDTWTGYNIATNHDKAGSIVKFIGQLVGNENAALTLNKYGYNAFANSYTAPVNLKSIVDGALAVDGSDGAVWVYYAEDALATGVKEFVSYGADVSADLALKPMQAFFVLHESDATDVINVNYATAVLGYNKKDAEATDYKTATFTITGGGEADSFTLFEGEQFSTEASKKGYNIKQMDHSFIKLYAVQDGNKYAKFATTDVDGVELTMDTKTATEYVLSFSNIPEDYKFTLKDIETGEEIEVGNDKTYTFTAAANSTIKRFRFGKSEVSADEADANNVNVWVADNSMNIAGAAEGDAIEIINLAGVTVLSATATGEAVQTISLGGIASGAYIVKAGAATVKVIK